MKHETETHKVSFDLFGTVKLVSLPKNNFITLKLLEILELSFVRPLKTQEDLGP